MKRQAQLVALVALLLPAAAQARVVEKIAAVVANDIILSSEVEERAAPFLNEVAGITDQAQRAARAAAVRREVLDRLIDDQLIQQQATELKVNVNSEDVDRSIEQIKKENSLSDEQLRAALQQQGMSMASYRQAIKKEIVRFRVLNVAVGSKVSVSESDLRAYYDRQVKSGNDVQLRASHIFLALPENADAGAVAEKKKLAGELAARARSGEDFAKLAKEYSDDAATRTEGGDLGTVAKDVLPKPIEEVIFHLRLGEVSDPVRAERGFHVIKLVERNAKAPKPFEEAKDEIRNKLRNREVEKQTKTYLADLRRRTLIDVRM